MRSIFLEMTPESTLQPPPSVMGTLTFSSDPTQPTKCLCFFSSEMDTYLIWGLELLTPLTHSA